MISEQLLQFIWQFQYFNKAALLTTAGEPVVVGHPGQPNNNQGPDFVNARIRIGDTLWAGNVELHIFSKDWVKHGHERDGNYKKIILHVVYEDNWKQHGKLPVVELKHRISTLMLRHYQNLMESRAFVPCGGQLKTVPDIVKSNWLERLLAERLLRRMSLILEYQQLSQQHWEQTFWWLLARNFGVPVNSVAFEAVAKSIPLQLLARHKTQLNQLEALLLGQAGLLEAQSFDDPYPRMLQREYDYLKKKYHLQPLRTPVHFLRMRPASFPTVRLAQLAAVIHHSKHLFSKIIEEYKLDQVINYFKVKPNDFWNYHYTLTDAPVFKEKRLGVGMAENIIINTVAPLLFAYGHYHDNQTLKNKATDWLSAIRSEQNEIVRGFRVAGIISHSSASSQALLELKKEYCDLKKCLHCGIGNNILKRTAL